MGKKERRSKIMAQTLQEQEQALKEKLKEIRQKQKQLELKKWAKFGKAVAEYYGVEPDTDWSAEIRTQVLAQQHEYAEPTHHNWQASYDDPNVPFGLQNTDVF